MESIKKNENNKNLLIFLHIQKTGGTTLGEIIKKQYPSTVFEKRGQKPQTITDLSSLSKKEVKDLKCFIGHVPFGIHHYFPQSCSYITLLRDPIERIISHYYFHRHYAENVMGFKEFINCKGRKSKIANLQTRYISWKSQLADFKRTKENLTRFMSKELEHVPNLERAKRNLENHFSVVGITDMFDESLFLMKKELGWKDIDYTRKNVTPNRPKREEISKEIIDIIKEKNQLDIKLYNYAKENLKDSLENLNLRFLH